MNSETKAKGFQRRKSKKPVQCWALIKKIAPRAIFFGASLGIYTCLALLEKQFFSTEIS
jgi:hypothetical protein